jgi:hypothetical protein
MQSELEMSNVAEVGEVHSGLERLAFVEQR